MPPSFRSTRNVTFNALALMLAFPLCGAQPGTDAEPIRYTGEPKIVDQHYHDGQLRPAVGVHSYQVLRANKTHPPEDDASGNSYNHSPMLVYWQGKFLLSYIGAAWHEHGEPTQTYLTTSPDGVTWSQPKLLFPAIAYAPGRTTVATQRMAFYVAPNGRLLVNTFLGIGKDEVNSPNTGFGVGRVVREIRADGSWGPICFLRYMPHAGYTADNTRQWHPDFRASADEGFKAACEALQANKLVTQQWWEEDRSKDGFYALDDSIKGFSAKALASYHRLDGTVVGLWKMGWAALSRDEGRSWSPPVRIDSKPTEAAKAWGQRTADGRFALAYSPMPKNYQRWPLAVITGDDGIVFDDLLVLQTEVPVARFTGKFKNPGSNYVRGIAEGNGQPPGSAFWVTYSMNKEDLWVSSVPTPVTGRVTEPVRDDFESAADLARWNIYSPQWAPVTVSREQGKGVLRLDDRDRHDDAKAVRVFPEAAHVRVEFKVNPRSNKNGQFEIDLTDRRGERACTIQFVSGRNLLWATKGHDIAALGGYREDAWLHFVIEVDARRQRYSVTLNGRRALADAAFYGRGIETVERLEFRTGFYRREDSRPYYHFIDEEVALQGADAPAFLRTLLIDEVRTLVP